MGGETPKISENQMYKLLRDEQIEEFNKRKAAGEEIDLRGTDFRGLDLRGMDVKDIDFSNSYFRGADLRGLNMSTCRLEGASIRDAKISGTYFPRSLSPEEILLSHKFGTRMRPGS